MSASLDDEARMDRAFVLAWDDPDRSLRAELLADAETRLDDELRLYRIAHAAFRDGFLMRRQEAAELREAIEAFVARVREIE